MPPTKRGDAETILPDLDAELSRLRSNLYSFSETAWILRRDHGITVTGETVRQWCADDGPEAA